MAMLLAILIKPLKLLMMISIIIGVELLIMKKAMMRSYFPVQSIKKRLKILAWQ
jgi:hypothetical protein